MTMLRKLRSHWPHYEPTTVEGDAREIGPMQLRPRIFDLDERLVEAGRDPGIALVSVTADRGKDADLFIEGALDRLGIRRAGCSTRYAPNMTYRFELSEEHGWA
jgi:hypothetical protein